MRIIPIAVALSLALAGPAIAASTSAKMTGQEQNASGQRALVPSFAIVEDAWVSSGRRPAQAAAHFARRRGAITARYVGPSARGNRVCE